MLLLLFILTHIKENNDKTTEHFQATTFDLNGEKRIENFKLENTMLLLDHSSFVPAKDLIPFTVELLVENE